MLEETRVNRGLLFTFELRWIIKRKGSRGIELRENKKRR